MAALASVLAPAAAALCTLLALARAQNPAPNPAASAPAVGADEAPSRDFAVRCGTLLTGDGTTVMRSVWLIVKDGKVLSVGNDAPPSDLPVVDAANKVVMPGIVAVDSDLAPGVGGEYQITPDGLAIDSFDFDRKWISALQGGVTTAYLSPGRQRLVSGQGAVVKLAGRDVVERVLTENACLRIEFGESATRAPRVFEPVPHPTSDEPLEAARIQTPTSRISLLAELRAVFAAATDKVKAPGGQGPAEDRYDERPLADVVSGKLPVRAGAFRSQDVRRALELQKELGIRMVLEDPQEIEPVANLAAAQKVAATFRVPVRFGQQNPGGEDRLQKQPEPRPEAPAKASAAGMIIGLAPASGVSLRDYLMAVAIAVRHGLPPAKALRGIGADAAIILGVAARVGTLEAGKDADFLVLSGEPLSVGTMVESTWIDGRRAFARKTESRALAVRAGRILDGTGRVYKNGVILVQDGRIKGVGEDLSVPYGAEVLDLGNGVMTPGFIDAFSHLGLAGEGSGVPQGAPNQRLHDAIDCQDPMFQPALAEGLTTLLVSGRDASTVNSRVTAIKTGASDVASMVVRAIAGQRLAHDAIGPDATKPIADQIQRGKQYVELWRKYEKDLAEWQQGKRPEAVPATAPATPPIPAATPAPEAKLADDPVTGVWESDFNVQGRTYKLVFDLKLEGTKVTGTIKIAIAGREVPPQEISSGTFEGGKLKLESRSQRGVATLEATLEGDTMKGTLSMPPFGELAVTGKRTSQAASPAAAPKKGEAKATEDGKPKAPKVDENLEPMRAIIEQRAALVVRCNRAAALVDVMTLLDKEQIPYVLQGAEDLLEEPILAKGRKPAILVGPEVVVQKEGELRNVAATFSDRDLPIMFGSGDCAGARHLPMHAAYAVRYGLSPADALQALTMTPARAFHLDDRIGSLEKGKDADFVVFSGNPFEPQSRVLLVVCNGAVVVDHREGRQ
ncbi:MAG TPA: amidohydrolase family protein [Planctomycetota bacterium]|nr:amidohydrolase family protein [Planctomycetota bacterium]